MATPRIILITGANTGIGLETVKALYKSSNPHHILLCGRSENKAEDAAAQVKVESPSSSNQISTLQLDVTDDDSIDKAVKTMTEKFGHIDTLINNAGASFDGDAQAGGFSAAAVRKAWSQTWEVNVTSAYVVTRAFIPLLIKSSDPRLLFLTSGLSSLTRASEPPEAQRNLPANQSPPAGWPKESFAQQTAYRSSKVGLNMMMVEFQRMLKNDGVKVWSISPGLLATGLGGNPEFLKKIGAKSPHIGGEFIRDVVEGKRDADVGKVVFNDGSVQPW